MTEKIKSIWS